MESNNLRDKIADFVWRREQTPVEGAQQVDPDRQGILSRLAGGIRERWDTASQQNVRKSDGQIHTTSRSGRVLNQETGQFEEPDFRLSTQTDSQFRQQDAKMRFQNNPVVKTAQNVFQGLTEGVEKTGQTASVGSAVQEAIEPPQEAQAEEPVKEEVISAPDPKHDMIRRGILYTENRGAIAAGEDPYKSIGVTGDLGKYQVKPETLKDWSRGWLGKEYTPEQFLNSPKLQEEFMNQFLAVVDRLGLSPDEASMAWHKGWGELGTGDKKTRDARFLKGLRARMKEAEADENSYLNTFRKGIQEYE
jgi:hypothetical protein